VCTSSHERRRASMRAPRMPRAFRARATSRRNPGTATGDTRKGKHEPCPATSFAAHGRGRVFWAVFCVSTGLSFVLADLTALTPVSLDSSRLRGADRSRRCEGRSVPGRRERRAGGRELWHAGRAGRTGRHSCTEYSRRRRGRVINPELESLLVANDDHHWSTSAVARHCCPIFTTDQSD
jgi:hypothetical protein